MNEIFAGRKVEIAILQGLLHTSQSEMVALTGRRRVGKTYLAKHVYATTICFHFTGIKDASKVDQLTAFGRKLASYYSSPLIPGTPADWYVAFEQLKTHINNQKSKHKKVVFLDEIPWMATHRSGFMSALEHFWNDWAVDQNLVLVVCGSATSWMIQHVINNRGGLHNRITKYLSLKPFSLIEVEEFMKAKGIKMPRYELLQIFMAMGGVPHYLKEIQGGQSAIQNIDRICFSSTGLLKNEFINLYRSLFDHYKIYEEIVTVLALKRRGLTRGDIIQNTSLTNGGGLTRILKELEESSFIESYGPFGKKKRETLYRLIDEYSIFYLNFIQKEPKASDGIWLKLSQTPKYRSWAGFAFEGICLKHLNKIEQALGITGVYTESSGYISRGDEKSPGFQLDLIINRNDNAINLCEMKFSQSEISLSKSDADHLSKRREKFRSETGTKKYLFSTLITTFGLNANQHSIGLIDHVITMDQLF